MNPSRSTEDEPGVRSRLQPDFDLILARVEGVTSRANASAVFGPRGFGHSHDRAEVVEEEATEIRDAARRLLGGETLSSIVRDWNRRGLRTTTGRSWRVNSLSALLIQPRLAGFHVDERHVYTAMWPPIFDRETHDRLVALRNSRTVVRRRPRRSLLAGIVKCGKCGGALHFLHRHDASELYRCPAPAAGGCSGVTINAEALESYVQSAVLQHVDSSDFIAVAQRCIDDLHEDDLDHLVHQIRTDRQALKDLARMWSRREITRLEWEEARRETARRLTAKEAALRAVEASKPLLRLPGKGALLSEQWDSMGIEERREVIKAVVKRIIVEPVGTKKPTPASERIRILWRRG